MLPPHPPARRKKTQSEPAKRPACTPRSTAPAPEKASRRTPHLRILGRTSTPPRFITAKSRRLAEC